MNSTKLVSYLNRYIRINLSIFLHAYTPNKNKTSKLKLFNDENFQPI